MSAHLALPKDVLENIGINGDGSLRFGKADQRQPGLYYCII